MDKKLVIGSTVAGLLVFGLGSAAGASGKSPAAAPAPAPTVTVTAPAPAPEIKTVTEEVTPQSCIDALDQASVMVGVLSKVGTLASKSVMAAYERDSATLQDLTGQVKDLNAQVTAGSAPLGVVVAACRAAAK
jgi:hypothetical protein